MKKIPPHHPKGRMKKQLDKAQATIESNGANQL
jgi:hypothetical protein